MQTEKIFPIISEQLPDYVREEFDTFVKFIDYYYEFLDKDYQTNGEESDTVTASDDFAVLSSTKNLSDTATAVETFDTVVDYIRSYDDVATAEDLTTLDISKDHTETLTASETFSRTVDYTRSYSEGQVSSDSGYIVLLDTYVESNYFAEDYVGDVRTF